MTEENVNMIYLSVSAPPEIGSNDWWSELDDDDCSYDEEEIFGCFGSNLDFKSVQSDSAKTDVRDDLSENFE